MWWRYGEGKIFFCHTREHTLAGGKEDLDFLPSRVIIGFIRILGKNNNFLSILFFKSFKLLLKSWINTELIALEFAWYFDIQIKINRSLVFFLLWNLDFLIQ